MTTNPVYSRRRGLAAVWALVVISIVTVFSAAIARQFFITRQTVLAETHQTQTLWLARGGVELAVEKLLAEPEKYTGEVVKTLPNAEVKITVTKDPTAPDVYRITSEARYPTDAAGATTRTVQSVFKRSAATAETRMERIPDLALATTP